MYNRKRIELKVEPCGTPNETGKGFEKLFPILTIWVRFVKKLLRSSRGFPWIPYSSSFLNKIA